MNKAEVMGSSEPSPDSKSLLDGANWTADMNSRFHTLTDNEGMPMAQARAIVLQEAGVSIFPKLPAVETSAPSIEISDSDIAEATQRVLVEDGNLVQPAPPKSSESDEQIRDRHRKALMGRDASPPEGFDPDQSARILKRMSSGDYTMPEDSDQQLSLHE